MTTLVLHEQISLAEAQFDLNERVARNVTLIKSGMSQNRRNYPEAVLQKSISIFEGAKAYDSHVKGGRRVGEITGWYKNVRYENGALVADRYFSRTDAGRNVMAVVEDIMNGSAPASLAGLSINAVGSGNSKKFPDGGEGVEVESITAATSVDDVTDPAAGGGYRLVAGNEDAFADEFLRSLSFEEWREAQPKYVERLQREWKTVRLEEATKTALAEADQKVKAAAAETDRMSQTLNRTQKDLETLREASVSAASELAAARRELLLERTLRAAQLPAVYENDLRNRLLALNESEWASTIQTEKVKAARVGHGRVDVSGSGTQIAPRYVVEESVSYEQVETPEAHAAFLAKQHRR